MARNKDLEDQPKRMSSGKHVICIDKIDCCLSCIRRRRKGKRSPKKKVKNHDR
jgi:hypothetical protein